MQQNIFEYLSTQVQHDLQLLLSGNILWLNFLKCKEISSGSIVLAQRLSITSSTHNYYRGFPWLPQELLIQIGSWRACGPLLPIKMKIRSSQPIRETGSDALRATFPALFSPFYSLIMPITDNNFTSIKIELHFSEMPQSPAFRRKFGHLKRDSIMQFLAPFLVNAGLKWGLCSFAI